MTLEFILDSFDALSNDWKQLQKISPISFIFSTPEWSEVWWQQFGAEYTLYLGSVKKDEKIIGIAPLYIKDNTAFFIGSSDTCDYLDFIVAPGEEYIFFNTLLDNLAKDRITQLNLAPVRPDSTVFNYLSNIANQKGLPVSFCQEDVSLEMNLPETWKEYLLLLSRKQRHELKRKLRRLEEIGEVNHRPSIDTQSKDIDIFLNLFRESREDKAAFLTPEMDSFFRSLANTMAKTDYLRLNLMELNKIPIAATLCFDFRNTMYLYNSGYNTEYSWLSAGIISKALCIKDSIEKGKKSFDFLKGNEEYKYHLGGKEISIYRYFLILTT